MCNFHYAATFMIISQISKMMDITKTQKSKYLQNVKLIFFQIKISIYYTSRSNFGSLPCDSRRQFFRVTKFQNSSKPFLFVFLDTCVNLSHDCLETLVWEKWFSAGIFLQILQIIQNSYSVEHL